MALARSRMMADVAKATVVVTNPTHLAVALRFVPGETDVPQVLAKGRGRIAERIRELALQHRVPVVCDPPLARALYRIVQVGGVIPARLYRAVAEVLALVLRGSARPTEEA
jgi:flagellar biosynthetic protein FlhB